MKIINPNHNFFTTRKVTSDPLQYPILSPQNQEQKGEEWLSIRVYFKQSDNQASGLSDNSPLP